MTGANNMARIIIQLSEDEIERLINGETVSVPIDLKTKGDAEVKQINIMQSALKDIAAPVINRDKKVVSQMEIDHIKLITESMTKQMMNENSFRLGS